MGLNYLLLSKVIRDAQVEDLILERDFLKARIESLERQNEALISAIKSDLPKKPYEDEVVQKEEPIEPVEKPPFNVGDIGNKPDDLFIEKKDGDEDW